MVYEAAYLGQGLKVVWENPLGIAGHAIYFIDKLLGFVDDDDVILLLLGRAVMGYFQWERLDNPGITLWPLSELIFC